MKFILVLLALSFPLISQANIRESLTAPPFRDSLNEVLNERFVYAGHWLKFGFNSIDSCLWKSADTLVIKNYCFPERKYPARGWEIWSKKFGVINIYEEKTPNGILLKRISISQFPEKVSGIFPDTFEGIDFQTLNEIDEKLYRRWNPACWSTNFSPYSREKEANCIRSDISLFGPWATETQQIVLSTQDWDLIFTQLADLLNTEATSGK